MRSRKAHNTSSIRFSGSVASVASCSGVSMMTSCAPMPFILSNMPSAERFRLPSMPSAGNLLGTTRTVHPCASRPVPFGRYASTSDGVLFSLPGQNGQNPPLFLTDSLTKSVGRLERSVEMMTHRPTMGSLRSSGTVRCLLGNLRYITPSLLAPKEARSQFQRIIIAIGKNPDRVLRRFPDLCASKTAWTRESRL